ncbi:MAG TPA: COX15/CtaA family protein, partial [Burkholderiaceae bacterium]
MSERDRRAVAAWLFLCAALTFAIVVVGGITRLTESGLSIAEWQPLVGALPPLSQSDWEALFARYRETPQFHKVFSEIGLEGFKRIFWWEYSHRLLGRTVGLVFLLPFLYFLWKRKVQGALTYKLLGVFILGGLQGALGWYMVKSGLVEDPRVSPFRLTAHLGLAILIFGAMLWVAMSLLFAPAPSRDDPAARSARRWSAGVAWLTFAMILTGGFVAGIRAGFAYNTFPLMNGSIVPPEILMLEPWWSNFFWNMATVQFDHRLGAWLLAFTVPAAWWAV